MDSEGSPRRQRKLYECPQIPCPSYHLPCPYKKFKEVRPMNKKRKIVWLFAQTVEKAVIRDEQNRRIQSAATNPVKEVLKILHTTLRGVRSRYRIRKPFQIRYEQSHPRKKRNPWQNVWRVHLSTLLLLFYFALLLFPRLRI